MPVRVHLVTIYDEHVDPPADVMKSDDECGDLKIMVVAHDNTEYYVTEESAVNKDRSSRLVTFCSWPSPQCEQLQQIMQQVQ